MTAISPELDLGRGGSSLDDALVSARPEGRAPAAEVPSFDAVYEASFDFVWRSLRRLGVAPASIDDAVQEVFLVVHRRLPEFEGRSSIKTWLFAIALRVAKDQKRTLRRKGGHEPLDLQLADGGPSPAEALAQVEALRVIDRLLTKLDDDKRNVFVLAEIEQLTAPEIAEALAVNVNTVYSRLRAARKEFEAALAGCEGDLR